MKRISFILSLVALFSIADAAASVRIKDITTLKGVRSNQLIGYGLVVGLDGSGDGTSNQFTIQTMVTMLNNLGVGVDPEQVRARNVASVIVTADLQPFSRMGQKIDILVSSLGDAESLQGGTLLLTPLKGADGQVYAVGQGPVTTGGFAASSGDSQETKNHTTVGKVPGGAVIEKELPFDFADIEKLTYSLKTPDFTTANRVVARINRRLSGKYAFAPDSGTIEVKIPDSYKGRVVELVSRLESLRIDPDAVAKIIVNERTGTVVVGEDVKISTVAIAHGNLTISIQPDAILSQPEPLSEGESIIFETPQVEVSEGEDNLAVIPGGVKIGDLVKALNAIGITPRDLIAVFQAIKAAGALQAELEII